MSARFGLTGTFAFGRSTIHCVWFYFLTITQTSTVYITSYVPPS